MTSIQAPDGFVACRAERVQALFATRIAVSAQQAGLMSPEALVRPRPSGPGTGRGPRVVVDLTDETGATQRVLVKQYLRGGWLARFNPERYASPGRFVQELRVSGQAERAGCPVAPALGCVFERSGWGWRAWGLSAFVDDAPDLARWLSELAPDDTHSLVERAHAAIARMHEGGLFHADLNLGNLIARRDPEHGFRVWVIDLDRARFYPGGVPRDLRARALARLDRSYRKIFSQPAPASLVTD